MLKAQILKKTMTLKKYVLQTKFENPFTNFVFSLTNMLIP